MKSLINLILVLALAGPALLACGDEEARELCDDCEVGSLRGVCEDFYDGCISEEGAIPEECEEAALVQCGD